MRTKTGKGWHYIEQDLRYFDAWAFLQARRVTLWLRYWS
jgi:hypothetical protein